MGYGWKNVVQDATGRPQSKGGQTVKTVTHNPVAAVKEAVKTAHPNMVSLIRDPVGHVKGQGGKISSGYQTVMFGDPKNGQRGPGGGGFPPLGPVAPGGAQPTQSITPEQLAAIYKKQRETGMAEGAAFGSAHFGGGFSQPQIQGMVGQGINAYLDQAMNGMNAAQFGAMRNRAVGGLDQSLAQNMMNLNAQQGASGVRGAAAMAQKQNMLHANQRARGDLENQFMLNDINVRNQGLSNLMDTLNGERAGYLGAVMGHGNLAVQDYVGAQQSILGDKMLGIAQHELGEASAPLPDTWMEKNMKPEAWDPRNHWWMKQFFNAG